ncbi:hypothetical protein OCU04_011401 [Sclerotinia nivalis]|uniref:FAS1 domain-containing protein n=1 Tax=Sclerotinia nivalis TaxID=352851 RepID=A0A9X0ABM5_9HELO|nr:hypothetical protein OCU04_011401 [Sclerotinia nivalis]
MYTPSLFSLALLASGVTAQMSLSQAIAANNGTLSTLSMLLGQQPALAGALSNTSSGITVLAPSNAAFAKFLAMPANKAAVGQSDIVAAVLQYHVLNGTFPASKFTNEAQFVPTLLTNESYTQVTGGQVVQVALNGSNAVITTGLKETSTTTQTDIMFNGGVIHIIDTVLTIPLSPAMSAIDSNLLSLAGALTKTSLVDPVNSLNDVTIFAPSNDAFEKIGDTAAALPTTQLSQILEYHVLNGTVGYSTLLTTGLANESFPTLMGESLTVTSENSKVFINSAQVITTDIIVSNGVMHVIDNVLNPSNETVVENPTAATQPVAFEGATSAASPPFTSGIMATTTAPSAAMDTNIKTGAGDKMLNGERLGGAVAAVMGAAAMMIL